MPVRVLLTLGDLRRSTANLPDDTAVVIEYGDCDDFHEASDHLRHFRPSLDAPGALILTGGQEITKDHYLIERLDVALDSSSTQGDLLP